jgi:antitoxin MazE
MRTRIVRIGNSQGIRIPKALLDETGLQGDVEISVRGGSLVIQAVRQPRAGWEQAFREMALRGDDQLLDSELISNGASTVEAFDAEDWEWE